MGAAGAWITYMNRTSDTRITYDLMWIDVLCGVGEVVVVAWSRGLEDDNF